MRWFNWVGIVMLVLGIGINDVLYLAIWHDFNILWIAAFVAYLLVAIGLSLWDGPSEDEPRKRPA